MVQPSQSTRFADKMRAAGLHAAAIRAFQRSYEELIGGKTGLIEEDSIQAIDRLPRFDEVSQEANASLLEKTAIIKLNGGLGTGMGLDKPKSLLPIRDTLTFLDFIVRQVQRLRRVSGGRVTFLLMNSFSTSAETRRHLKLYPELGAPESLELMQSRTPKVDATTLGPVSWPANPELEWCPPGHGDIYASLDGSGWLDRLLSDGIQYLFVSNSDNLGATLDLGLLSYFARSNASLLMEVAERTEADRKGGHLARGRDGRLRLREAAQCPESDQTFFQDVRKHRFFNTNNVWLRADRLKELLGSHCGVIPLPLIRNEKPVDARDAQSPRVFQLETALGSAIECFPDSAAIVVPRTRFVPVKNTSDLLVVRSDAYQVAEDWSLALASECAGHPPMIQLDPKHYQTIEQLDVKFLATPSLRYCRELLVEGAIQFPAGIEFRGNVRLINPGESRLNIPPGKYEDVVVRL